MQVKSFRVQKQTLFGEFRGQLETEFGVPRARQRLWFWEQRPNFTLRPWQPVPPDADEQQVQTVRTPRNVKNPHQQGANELFLWLGALLCIFSSLAMLYLQQCLSIGRTLLLCILRVEVALQCGSAQDVQHVSVSGFLSRAVIRRCTALRR